MNEIPDDITINERPVASDEVMRLRGQQADAAPVDTGVVLTSGAAAANAPALDTPSVGTPHRQAPRAQAAASPSQPGTEPVHRGATSDAYPEIEGMPNDSPSPREGDAPDELRQDIADTRASMAHTIDAIQERLRPEQVSAYVAGQARARLRHTQRDVAQRARLIALQVLGQVMAWSDTAEQHLRATNRTIRQRLNRAGIGSEGAMPGGQPGAAAALMASTTRSMATGAQRAYAGARQRIGERVAPRTLAALVLALLGALGTGLYLLAARQRRHRDPAAHDEADAIASTADLAAVEAILVPEEAASGPGALRHPAR